RGQPFEVFRDRIHESGDGIARRLDGGLDVRLRGRLCGHRTYTGDDGRREQVGRRLDADDAYEIPNRRRARERHDIDATFEQHAVDVRLAFAVRVHGDRAVGDDLGDVGAFLPQLIGEQLAADVGVRQEDLLASDFADLRERAEDRLRTVLGRGEVDF